MGWAISAENQAAQAVRIVLSGSDNALSRAEAVVGAKVSVGTMARAKVKLDLNVEMVRKPENADHDEIDRHNVVEQSRHNQSHGGSLAALAGPLGLGRSLACSSILSRNCGKA
jgi:hypothetical protein